MGVPGIVLQLQESMTAQIVANTLEFPGPSIVVYITGFGYICELCQTDFFAAELESLISFQLLKNVWKSYCIRF